MLALLEGERQFSRKFGQKRHKGFIRVTKKVVDTRDNAEDTATVTTVQRESSSFDLGITGIQDKTVRLPTIDEPLDNGYRNDLAQSKQKGKGRKLPDLLYVSEPPSNKSSRIDLSLSIEGRKDLQLPPPRTPTESRKIEKPQFRQANCVNREYEEDLSALHKHLEELLICHSMGIPIEISKRDFKSGVVARPMFHCPRCLGHWKEYGILPDKCEEVFKPTHGPAYKLNTQSSQLLQNLSEGSQERIDDGTIIIKIDTDSPVKGGRQKRKNRRNYVDGKVDLRSNSSSSLGDDSSSADEILNLDDEFRSVENKPGVSSKKSTTSKTKSKSAGGETDQNIIDRRRDQRKGNQAIECSKKSQNRTESSHDKKSNINESFEAQGKDIDRRRKHGLGFRETSNVSAERHEPAMYSGAQSQFKAVGNFSFGSGPGELGSPMGQQGPDGYFYPGSYGPDGRFIPVGRVGKDGQFHSIVLGPDGKQYVNGRYGPDGTFYPGEEIQFNFLSAPEVAIIKQRAAQSQHEGVKGPDGNFYPRGYYEPDGTFRPGGPPQPQYDAAGNLIQGAMGPGGGYYPNGKYIPDGTFIKGGLIGPDGLFYPDGQWGPNGEFMPSRYSSREHRLEESDNATDYTDGYSNVDYNNHTKDGTTSRDISGIDRMAPGGSGMPNHGVDTITDRQATQLLSETSEEDSQDTWGGEFNPKLTKLPVYHGVSNPSSDHAPANPSDADTDVATTSDDVVKSQGFMASRHQKLRKRVRSHDGGWVEGIDELDEDVTESLENYSDRIEESDHIEKGVNGARIDTSEGYYSDTGKHDKSEESDTLTPDKPGVKSHSVHASINQLPQQEPVADIHPSEDIDGGIGLDERRDSPSDDEETECTDPNCKIKGKHKHKTSKQAGRIFTLKDDVFDNLPKSRRRSVASDIETASTSSKGSSTSNKGKKNVKNLAVRNVTGKPGTKPGALGKHVFAPSTGTNVGSYAGVITEEGKSQLESSETKKGQSKKGKQRGPVTKSRKYQGSSKDKSDFAEELEHKLDEDTDVDGDDADKKKNKREIVKKIGKQDRKVISRVRNVETGQGDQTPGTMSAIEKRRRSSLMLAEPAGLASRPSSTNNLSRCDSDTSHHEDETKLKYTRSKLPRKDSFEELLKRSTTLPKVPEVMSQEPSKLRRSPTKEELLQLKQSMSFDRFARVDRKEKAEYRSTEEKKSSKSKKSTTQTKRNGESVTSVSSNATYDTVSTSVSSQWKSDVDLPRLESLSVLNFTRSFTFSFFELPEQYRERNAVLKRAANDISRLKRQPRLKQTMKSY